MREPAWLDLEVVRASIKLAKRWRISAVAASRGGFGPAFVRAKGNPDRLGVRSKDGQHWRSVRNGFVARHMAQVKKNQEGLFYNSDGSPTPRLIALAVWAYAPSQAKRRYINWLKAEGLL